MGPSRRIRLVRDVRTDAGRQAPAGDHPPRSLIAPVRRIDIRSRCSEGRQLTLMVVPSGLLAGTPEDFECFLRRIDGRALPDWMVQIKRAEFAGTCPHEVESVDLKVHAVFGADGHELVREFRVDTRTGAITWLPLDGKPRPPLFRDQITRFSHFSDDSADGLAELLIDDEPKT